MKSNLNEKFYCTAIFFIINCLNVPYYFFKISNKNRFKFLGSLSNYCYIVLVVTSSTSSTVLPTKRAPTFYDSSSFFIMLKGQPIRASITFTLVAVPSAWVVH